MKARQNLSLIHIQMCIRDRSWTHSASRHKISSLSRLGELNKIYLIKITLACILLNFHCHTRSQSVQLSVLIFVLCNSPLRLALTRRRNTVKTKMFSRLISFLQRFCFCIILLLSLIHIQMCIRDSHCSESSLYTK